MKKIVFIPVLMISTACENLIINETLKTDQQAIFELLWKDFDENYAGFTVRNMDWDSVYAATVAEINSGLTSNEYQEVIGQIFLSYMDIHTNLFPRNGSSFEFDPSNSNSLSSIGSIDHYFEKSLSKNKVLEWVMILNEDIGYIHITTFDQSPGLSEFLFIDEIITQFKDTEGLIIDIRLNPGGDLAPRHRLASRFIDGTFVATKHRFRNGPRHDDFGEPIIGTISPEGPDRYLKPIVIVMNKSSNSNAEIFAMTLETQGHVTTVGDHTAGGLGLFDHRELPNGWNYRLTTTLNSNENDIVYEFNGVPPDEVIYISKQDSISGSDPQLERAIELLKK